MEPHAHLRRSHQAGIGGYGQRMQCTNHVGYCLRKLTACCASLEVRAKPLLLRMGKISTQSDQGASLVMYASDQGCAPSNRSMRMLSPRYSRDLTVPSRAPVTTAISSKANSS